MEEKEFLEDGKTPNPKFVKKEENNGGKSDEGTKAKDGKTFTEEEHQAELDRVAAKTRSEGDKKAEKAAAEAVEKALAEERRLAGLKAEEREKELLDKQKRDAEAREANITLRENRATAVEKLAELKLSPKMADFLVDIDIEKQDKNIAAFAEAYAQSVKEGVAEVTKGKTPSDPAKGDSQAAKGEIENFL